MNMKTCVQFRVFVIIYTTLTFDTCLTVNSVCPKRKSHIVGGNVVFFNETICCDNYELRDDQCVECDIGLFRPDDLTPEKCIPCEEGTYGKKCAYACTCQSNERIDKISAYAEHPIPFVCNVTRHQCRCASGAVKKSCLTDVPDVLEARVYYRKKPELNVCNSITGCVQKHIEIDDTPHGSTNDRWKKIGYGIAIGVVLICICIFSAIVLVKKRNRIFEAEMNIPSMNSIEIPLANQAVEAVALNPLDQCYEEIDETTLGDLPNFDEMQLESDSDSKEESQSKSATEDDDGYLNPYNSLLNSPPSRTYHMLNLANK